VGGIDAAAVVERKPEVAEVVAGYRRGQGVGTEQHVRIAEKAVAAEQRQIHHRMRPAGVGQARCQRGGAGFERAFHRFGARLIGELVGAQLRGVHRPAIEGLRQGDGRDARGLRARRRRHLVVRVEAAHRSQVRGMAVRAITGA